MIGRILITLRKIWLRITGNPFHGVVLSHITDEDLQFDPDIDRMIMEAEMSDPFRSFMTIEEYNKEFIVFFKAHRNEFLLDYSQRDGHFRV